MGSDVIIGKAYDELVGYNWTKEEQAMYEWIKKNEDDNVSCLKQSKIEGKIEVAKAMLAEGMDFTTVARLTELSIDEIEKLN